jgi:hypothetical protein
VTEAEWLACGDPEAMRESLRDKASDRTLRLFMAACCRRVWHALDDEEYRQEAVEVAEKFADGLASADDLESAFGDLTDGNPLHVWDDIANASVADFEEFDATSLAAAEAFEAAVKAVGEDYDRGDAIRRAEGEAQAGLARCVFGNPFRPAPALAPAWLRWNGGTVSALARAVYEERELPSGHLDPVRLALLADMLEDAGCTDVGILEHLRGPGPHVRGCWVVDLVLGKS